MNRIVLLLLLLFFALQSFSQPLKGKVIDSTSGKPIPFASVYFNGTFRGGSCDERGVFNLEKKEFYKNMPLTVSAVGYRTAIVASSRFTKVMSIELFPEVYKVENVDVTRRSLERKRKRYLRLFRREFLGTTINSKHCTIKNEEDITFNYFSDRDTIKAFVRNPLLIENRALMYELTYFLDEFVYLKRNGDIFFCGNIKFTKDLIPNSDSLSLHSQRREASYLGSRMHLIRQLWNANPEAMSFEIYNRSSIQMNLCDLVKQDQHHHRFLVPSVSKLFVRYGQQKSLLEFVTNPIYIEENGFFDRGIKWSGALAYQRVADWLPYEYGL